MAASASVQSILSLPSTTRVGQRNRANNLLLSSVQFPRHQQRSGSLQVQCMAEDKLPEKPTPVSSTSSTPPPAAPQTPVIPPPAPKVKKISTKFSDVLAFSGPAPERINGRLAMIGFVAAIAAELAQGQDVVAQIANGGVPWFVGTSVVFTIASLIPLFKGVSVESKSNGLMTSDAELLNGRFAMLGLVALVFTEFVTGSALV
ncbi:Early light-induced protein [Thalictrum thalictroides]|uniref:Early light-induced protein n=1 Tax=Thalictrum thalictroides TaxID=46969 RepID=A0A7J6XB45_THATH|nr:Early light-induced protein [Thalictrum thalictroides]